MSVEVAHAVPCLQRSSPDAKRVQRSSTAPSKCCLAAERMTFLHARVAVILLFLFLSLMASVTHYLASDEHKRALL